MENIISVCLKISPSIGIGISRQGGESNYFNPDKGRNECRIKSGMTQQADYGQMLMISFFKFITG
jgi:hypothetical protein